MLALGLQRELYTKLVPAKYKLALGLSPVTQDDAAKAVADAARWCGPIPPFEHTTGVYLWPNVDHHYLIYYRWADTTITPIVLTTGDPGTGGTWKAANWTLFGRLFNAVDPGGNFGKGGLAINEQQFFESYGLAFGYDQEHRPGHFEHFHYAWNDSSLGACHAWDFQ